MVRIPIVGALFLAVGLLIAACEARVVLPHPYVQLEGPHYHGGYHCPPGQAMKGRC